MLACAIIADFNTWENSSINKLHVLASSDKNGIISIMQLLRAWCTLNTWSWSKHNLHIAKAELLESSHAGRLRWLVFKWSSFFNQVLLLPFSGTISVFLKTFFRTKLFRRAFGLLRSWNTVGGLLMYAWYRSFCAAVRATWLYHFFLSLFFVDAGKSPTISGAMINSFWMTSAVATDRFNESAKPCIGK